VEATEEEAMQVVAAVKNFSLGCKRLLTEEEFRKVVDTTLPDKTVSSGRAAHTRS
jgi:hypothetical protein